MQKLDAGKLREAVFAEYHDFPNPNDDPVTEFERRAAAVIADFAVLMVKEHNELQTPDPVLVEGVISVASIMIAQVFSFAPPHVKPQIVAHALATLEANLAGEGGNVVGSIDIPHRDVGDA